ncbi:MAG: FAD binding domain-containing protein [Rhodospirillaceae bacterium]
MTELVDLMAGLEDAKILAGGQSLMPMMNMRFVAPDDVVDINGVTELDFVERENGSLRIGAMTRQRALLVAPEIQDAAPVMREALGHVGHLQTRNRGTIGGSLCHLDPSAELPAIASLYGATLTVAGKEGEREVPMEEWVIAYMMPSIAPEEVLVSLSLPVWPEGHGYAFTEFARRHGDFAITAVGALVELSDNTITRAAITVAGADVKPTRLTDVEGNLAGQPANQETFKAAGAEAREIDAMSDTYVSAAYRQRLADTLVQRALASAADRAGGGE